MEICPKGNFIPILHLPVQVKVPKENIRTKRETSDAYLEHCQTAKRKRFAKTRNDSQLPTIVFIA